MRKPNPNRSNHLRLRHASRAGIELLEARVLLSSTLMVNSIDDSLSPSPGMLRYELSAAQSGDVIQFNPTTFPAGGSITLVPDAPLEVAANVTIQWQGARAMTISGNGASTTGRVFTVDSNATAEIDGLTITGGKMQNGNGGGIDNEGTLTLNNCTINGNSASLDGGGIYDGSSSTLTLNNCVVSGNHARYGAGIFELDGPLNVNASTITANTAPDGEGAGIYSQGSLSLTNSTVSQNSVDYPAQNLGGGGGLFAKGPTTISGSTFTGNSALNSVGGAIFVFGSQLNLMNSTLAGNSSGNGQGGAIFAAGAVLGVNCTIAGNSANFGGGIEIGGQFSGGDVTLYNCIVAGNTGTQSAADIDYLLDTNYTITGGEIAQTVGGGPASSNNLIDKADSAGGLTDKANGNLIGDAKAYTVDLGALASNGGPTQTMLPQADSAALDAGANSLAQDYSVSPSKALATDQRGLPRVFGPSVDIGAAEAEPPATPASLAAVGGADQVTLAWSAAPGVSGYNIYRGTIAGQESATPIATNVGGTSYLDANVTAGVTYYYTVKAVNGSSESAASPEASATPNLPVINAATDGDTITLQLDPDNLHVDWTTDKASGQVLMKDPIGLTINGDANTDTITLSETPGSSGEPLPGMLHLGGAGTFDLNGLGYSFEVNPMAGHTIDIGQCTVYLQYSSLDTTLNLGLLKGYVANGYNNGAWNGAANSSTGMITTSAGSLDFGIGYADATDGSGIDKTPGTLELKYTVNGDANLDGTVNLADFLLLARNFGKTSVGWDQGDFNYDQTTNLSDLLALVRHFGKSVPPPPVAPTALSAAADPISGPFALRRRR